MDNRHPITGYRNLSGEEVSLINAIKQKGLELGAIVEALRDYPASDVGRIGSVIPRIEGDRPSIDQRWVSIGATHLQQGLMALTRAVAQPSVF